VTRGLAIIKFSGSVKKYGKLQVRKNNTKRNIKNPTLSLIVKYEWKETQSLEDSTPKGLEDPFSCRKRI
jgi:hypothetical protein